MANLLTGNHVEYLACPPIDIHDEVLDPAKANDLRMLVVYALGVEKSFGPGTGEVSVPGTWDRWLAKEMVVEASVSGISDLKLAGYRGSVARSRSVQHFLYSLRHRAVSNTSADIK